MTRARVLRPDDEAIRISVGCLKGDDATLRRKISRGDDVVERDRRAVLCDHDRGFLFASTVLGLWVYEKLFFKTAWRPLYLWVTVISAGFSLLQVLLVTGNTFGVPDIFFATGDLSLQDFVQMLTFIPMCVMFFAMIPAGTEGTALSLIHI